MMTQQLVRSPADQHFCLDTLELNSRIATDREIVNLASLGTVTVRYAPGGIAQKQLNELSQRLADSNIIFVATTILKGVKTLRMCPINPRTTQQDIDITLVGLSRIAVDCGENGP